MLGMKLGSILGRLSNGLSLRPGGARARGAHRKSTHSRTSAVRIYDVHASLGRQSRWLPHASGPRLRGSGARRRRNLRYLPSLQHWRSCCFFRVRGSKILKLPARQALAYALKLNFDFAVLAVRSQLALTRMLQGHTEVFGSLGGPRVRPISLRTQVRWSAAHLLCQCAGIGAPPASALSRRRLRRLAWQPQKPPSRCYGSRMYTYSSLNITSTEHWPVLHVFQRPMRLHVHVCGSRSKVT